MLLQPWLETLAAARVAVIYDPSFFENEDAAWELLIPYLWNHQHWEVSFSGS